MSITLGGVTISDNMYLDGINNAALISAQQYRSIDGLSLVLSKKQSGGRTITLGSVVDSSVMGIWCQSVVDAVKLLEGDNSVLVLDYHGDTYNVLITGMEFTQLFKFEPVTSNKKYTGTITMIEV